MKESLDELIQKQNELGLRLQEKFVSEATHLEIKLFKRLNSLQSQIADL